MKNKNITFFIGSLAGGGAERVVCNLANYLVERDNNVTVLTMSDIKDTYIVDKRVKRKYLLTKNERKNKIFDFFLRFKRLSHYMSSEKCDLYIVMLPITTIMMLLLRKKTKAKIIMSERADPASYSKIKQILIKKLSKKADGLVFQTEDAKSWYNLDNKKTIVIPNAINEEFLNLDFSNVKREKKIVSVGRLNNQKNFSLLIKAFSKLDEKFNDYNLIIYGEGTKRVELEEEIKNLNLDDRVFLPGYSKDIKKDIINASLFVMSSNFEGMPNALIEAMALGIPSISTDCPCGGSRYLIKNMKNGILIPVGDEVELIKQMTFLLTNEEEALKISDNAKQIVFDLNPEKIYGTWEKYIKSIIE